jgi:hypothetical protein
VVGAGTQVRGRDVTHAIRSELVLLLSALHHLEREGRVIRFQDRVRKDTAELLSGLGSNGGLESLDRLEKALCMAMRQMLTMKLANKNTRRSWAWLSGVFDSFWFGRGEPDCPRWAMFPLDVEWEDRWVIGLVPWVQALWELERLSQSMHMLADDHPTRLIMMAAL